MNLLADNTARLLRQCNELARCIGVEAPIRVLLVDDSDDYCMVFRVTLERVNGAKYIVDVVKNTRDAEAAIRACRHDIYVIDQCLNGESVIEFVKRLQEQGVHFPFVVLTAAYCDDRVAMGRDCMMWMHKCDFTEPRELDRALRYAMKNWLTRTPGGPTVILPPTAVPA